MLEQFRGSPLLPAGKVVVVALDGIAERFGARWGVRQGLVDEHAQRVLRRKLGEQALVQRISETEYVVAQPEVTRLAAHLRCLNCVREILHHFLGEAAHRDIRVHEVTRITDDGVFGRRLDANEVEAAAAHGRLADALDLPKPVSLDRWTPFTTSTGRRVGVTCALEPVAQLKTSGQIGYRVASRVQQLPSFATLSRAEFARLAPADIEKIDLATLARGLDRVRTTAAAHVPPTLILPVSYATLQSRRGRATMIELLRQGRSSVRHGLIVEITDTEGAPQGALSEAIASIRPLCLHVIGRVATEDARHLFGLRLDGVSARCPPLEGDAALIGWIGAFVRTSERVSKTLFLYQVDGMRRVHLACDLGVTHFTLMPQRLRAHILDDEPR